MKKYYGECTIFYTGKENNGMPYGDAENYSILVDAQNKKEATGLVKVGCLEKFNDEFEGETVVVKSIELETLYQTSDDARLD